MHVSTRSVHLVFFANFIVIIAAIIVMIIQKKKPTKIEHSLHESSVHWQRIELRWPLRIFCTITMPPVHASGIIVIIIIITIYLNIHIHMLTDKCTPRKQMYRNGDFVVWQSRNKKKLKMKTPSMKCPEPLWPFEIFRQRKFKNSNWSTSINTSAEIAHREPWFKQISYENCHSANILPSEHTMNMIAILIRMYSPEDKYLILGILNAELRKRNGEENTCLGAKDAI